MSSSALIQTIHQRYSVQRCLVVFVCVLCIFLRFFSESFTVPHPEQHKRITTESLATPQDTEHTAQLLLANVPWEFSAPSPFIDRVVGHIDLHEFKTVTSYFECLYGRLFFTFFRFSISTNAP